jgi:glutamine synthetase adenylyltransferase
MTDICRISVYLTAIGLKDTGSILASIVTGGDLSVVKAHVGFAVASAGYEVLKEVDDAAARARILELLEGLAARTTNGSTMLTETDQSKIRCELEVTMDVASVLASILVGEPPRLDSLLVDEELAETPRVERIEVPLVSIEPRIRALWLKVIEPWLNSDWVVQMQRMLSDALRVLRDIAREAPDDAATILKSWKLESRLSAFEPAIKHELVALVGLLLHHQSHRGYFESLLHHLAESGYGPALALIAELAQKLRNG